LQHYCPVLTKRWLGWLGGGLLTGGAVLAAFAWLGDQQPGFAAKAERAGSTRAPAASRLSGSAFAVAPGALVTNAHLTMGCRRQGRSPQVVGLPGTWQVLAEDPSTDLALLSGDETAGATLPLSSGTQLPRGTAVMALGYPAAPVAAAPGIVHSSTGHLLRATLTIHEPEAGLAASFVVRDRSGHEVAATWDDGLRYFGQAQAGRLHWLLEIDAATSGGSSGGPVLDGAGNVIGVIYAGDRGRRLTAVVPLDDLREFLRGTGIVPRFGVRDLNTNPDWRAVQIRAAQAVYRVVC
jgi:S1-C subfamily serine protease